MKNCFYVFLFVVIQKLKKKRNQFEKINTYK